MAQIVAFNVPDIDSGYRALDALDATEAIEDAVLVSKNRRRRKGSGEQVSSEARSR